MEWVVDNNIHDNAFGLSNIDVETTVECNISVNTTRRFLEIVKLYPGNFEFSKSSPIVKLFEIRVEFLSRSEAKRLFAGLDKFSEIIFEHIGIEKVGQGSVDEIYWVWKNQYSSVLLKNAYASSEVEFMLNRGGG